jgi:hypothetical protein
MGPVTHGFNPADDRLNLPFRGAFFHDDHHCYNLQKGRPWETFPSHGLPETKKPWEIFRSTHGSFFIFLVLRPSER